MLVPIFFNADDTNNLKKGNVRGEDLSSFFSIATNRPAGILNINENPCTADSNIDYNSNPGYAIITFNEGYISIYGRLIYIEKNTKVRMELPTTTQSIDGSIGVRISLSDSGSEECRFFYKTGSLRPDNLLKDKVNGIYEFRLYDYTATSTTLTLSNPTKEIIMNYTDYLKGANFETLIISDKSNKIATTEFVHNVKDLYTPKYEEIVLDNLIFKTEGTEQSVVNITCNGMIYYDEVSKKKIFYGNALCNIHWSAIKQDFDNCNTFRFQISNETKANYEVIHGGILGMKLSEQEPKNNNTFVAFYIPDGNSLTYTTEDNGKDFVDESYSISITGIMLKLL